MEPVLKRLASLALLSACTNTGLPEVGAMSAKLGCPCVAGFECDEGTATCVPLADGIGALDVTATGHDADGDGAHLHVAADTVSATGTTPNDVLSDSAAVSGSAPKAMVLVAAGKFMMGCVPGDSACGADEKPQHEIFFDAYLIDMLEVGEASYQGCVDAGTCTPPSTRAIARSASSRAVDTICG